MLIAYLVLLCEFFFRICEFSLLQTSGRYLLTSALKSDHFKQTPVIVDNGQFFTCPINISSYQKVTLANTDSSLSSVSCNKAYLFSERRKKMDDTFSIFTVLQLTAQEVQHQLLTIVIVAKSEFCKSRAYQGQSVNSATFNVPSIRWVSRRLRLRVQRVAFHYYIKKLPGQSIYTRHRNLSHV